MARSIVVVADSIFPELLFWLAAEAKALTAGDKGAKVSKGSKGGAVEVVPQSLVLVQ